MNRTILHILRCFIQGQQEDWDLHLATVGMAIRSTVNRQTGFTPNFLMLGREVLQPIQEVKKNEELLGHMLHDIRKPRGLLIEMPAKSTAISTTPERDYDLRLEERKYSVGDAHYRFNRSIVLGQSKRLQPIWSGHWLVTQVISSVLYRELMRNKERETSYLKIGFNQLNG